MPVQSTLPATFRFSTHNPTNLIVVENQEDGVLFRAAYGNFSERRKAFLIRQLAAEGYIPSRFEDFSEDGDNAGCIWVIEPSLLYIAPEARRRSSRFMRRLIVGGCLLWLIEMTLLLLRV